MGTQGIEAPSVRVGRRCPCPLGRGMRRGYDAPALKNVDFSVSK